MTLRNFSSTAAQTTLAAGVDSSATTLAVSATTGFPSVPFIIAVNAGAAAQELVLVTNVAGTNLTVTRGYDSTVAVSHDAGAVVAHSHGAIDFREANSHVNAESGVHGVTGDVVGNSDSQTLTNKTLALGSNTISGTKAQFNTAMTDDDFATLTGTETLTNKTLSAPSASGSLAGFGGALTATTPVVTASAGAFSAATAAMRHTQIGKLVFWEVTVTITTTGTATGSVRVAAPVTARASGVHCGGGKQSVAAAGCEASLVSTTSIEISRFDGASITAAGTVTASGWYEAA